MVGWNARFILKGPEAEDATIEAGADAILAGSLAAAGVAAVGGITIDGGVGEAVFVGGAASAGDQINVLCIDNAGLFGAEFLVSATANS